MVFINFAACEFAVSTCTNHQYLTVPQISNNKNNNKKSTVQVYLLEIVLSQQLTWKDKSRWRQQEDCCT